MKFKIISAIIGYSLAVLIMSASVSVFGQKKDDTIEAGSSVFVFKRKSSESSTNVFGKGTQKRTGTQKNDRRKKISSQIKSFAVKPAVVKPVPRPANPKPLPAKPTSAKTTKPPKVKDKNSAKDTKPKELTKEDKEQLAETWIQRAEEALKTDKPGEAVTAYRVAIAYNPENEDAKTGIISALVQNGDELSDKEDYEKALGFYQEALREEPQNVAAVIGLAGAFDGLEKNREAIFEYEKALKLNPDLTEVFLSLGVLHFEVNEYAKAEEYLQKSLAVELNKDEVYNYLGLNAFQQSRYPEATQYFNQAIAANADSGEAYHNLSEVFRRLRRDDEFLTNVGKAIAIYSKTSPPAVRLAEAQITLGRYYSAAGKFEESIMAFQNAIKANPKNLFAYRNLAGLYTQKGRLGEAIGIYRQMVPFAKDAKRGELAEIYGEYGLTALRQELWSEAAEALEKATGLEPEVADYVNLGSAYNKLAVLNKDNTFYTKAEGILQKAMMLEPNLAQTHLNLGDSRLGEGNAQAALVYYRKALELKPKWAEAHKGAALALAELGKFPEALAEIKRAINLEEKNIDVVYSLGVVYLKTGKPKEVEKVIRDLQKLDPQRAIELESRMKRDVKPN